MKKNLTYLFALALSLCAVTGFAQNVAINEDGSAPNPNAILDVKSYTKGVLIPRVSTPGRLAIPNTKGLLVYDTTIGSFWYNTGTVWQNMTQNATGWQLHGNSGTDSSSFLGTLDNQRLVLKANNQQAGLIETDTFRITGLGTGAGNTFWGYRAGPVSQGKFNTGIGTFALKSNTSGNGNIAIGGSALAANTTGSVNTATGAFALESNTTGVSNTAIGTFALKANKVGSDNTACGEGALSSDSIGNNNTALGINALITNISGNSNTALGWRADVSAGNFTNATAIGSEAIVNASNKIRLGNSAVTVIEGQVPFTTPSDGRFKYQVKEDVKGLDFILHLRPVTYQFDVKRFDQQKGNPFGNDQATPVNYVQQASYDEASRIRRSGFIAQDVEKAANASGYNFSGIIKPKTEEEHYSLSYESFVVPLVKGMQEQQQVIDAQQQKIAAQDKKLADLQQQLNEIKELMQRAK
jgi:hypothetical protein